jgi:hypothetical protein
MARVAHGECSATDLMSEQILELSKTGLTSGAFLSAHVHSVCWWVVTGPTLGLLADHAKLVSVNSRPAEVSAASRGSADAVYGRRHSASTGQLRELRARARHKPSDLPSTALEALGDVVCSTSRRSSVSTRCTPPLEGACPASKFWACCRKKFFVWVRLAGRDDFVDPFATPNTLTRLQRVECAVDSGSGHPQRGADRGHRLAGFSHPAGDADLIRAKRAGPSGLFAPGPGGLPGDSSPFVNQLALVLSQGGKDTGHHAPDQG